MPTVAMAMIGVTMRVMFVGILVSVIVSGHMPGPQDAVCFLQHASAVTTLHHQQFNAPLATIACQQLSE